MPTRFWVKKTGCPSSKNIKIATMKKSGEKRIIRKKANIRLII